MADRDRTARAKGFASFAEYRKATPEQRLAATERLARRDPTYHAGGKLAGRVRAVQRAEAERRRGPAPGPAPKVGKDRRQIIPTPAGTILSTTTGGRGWGVIERRLERWADAGEGVTIRHVWVFISSDESGANDLGQRVRANDLGQRVQLYRHGITVEAFVRAMRDAGGLKALLGQVLAATAYDEGGAVVVGCQIVTDAM
jgi:hypothetical protein